MSTDTTSGTGHMDQWRIREALADLFLRNFPPTMRGRRLALFGAPANLGLAVRFFAALNLPVWRVLDNNPAKLGSRDGVPILRAEHENVEDAFVLVLSTASYAPMADQLRGWGLSEGQDFASFFDCFAASAGTGDFALFCRHTKELLHLCEELHPWFINTSAARNLRAFLAAVRAIQGTDKSFQGADVLEVGCGNTLVPALFSCLLGAGSVMALDTVLQPNLFHTSQYTDLVAYLAGHFPELPLSGHNLGSAVGELDSLVQIQQDTFSLTTDRIEVRAPYDVCELEAGPQRFDIQFSTVVFEHLEDPERSVRALTASARPGVIGYHQIDLSGHQGESGMPEFYRLSRQEGREQYAKLSTNTLRKSEWEALFRTHGWEILESSAGLVLPPEALHAGEMHADFARLSEEDLRCLYLTLMVRRT